MLYDKSVYCLLPPLTCQSHRAPLPTFSVPVTEPGVGLMLNAGSMKEGMNVAIHYCSSLYNTTKMLGDNSTSIFCISIHLVRRGTDCLCSVLLSRTAV